MYKNDLFKFINKACNGSLMIQSSPQLFQNNKLITFTPLVIQYPYNLNWFPAVEPPQVSYNSSCITPGMVKSILKSKPATSAPGEDGVMYGVLGKMPCTHYLLAKLYNNLDRNG